MRCLSHRHRSWRALRACVPQDFEINKEVPYSFLENAPFFLRKKCLQNVVPPKFEMLPTSPAAPPPSLERNALFTANCGKIMECKYLVISNSPGHLFLRNFVLKQLANCVTMQGNENCMIKLFDVSCLAWFTSIPTGVNRG